MWRRMDREKRWMVYGELVDSSAEERAARLGEAEGWSDGEGEGVSSEAEEDGGLEVGGAQAPRSLAGPLEDVSLEYEEDEDFEAQVEVERRQPVAVGRTMPGRAAKTVASEKVAGYHYPTSRHGPR